MTKDQIKKLTKILLPVLIALGTAYGLVDRETICGDAPAPETPAAE